jgi:hypothetical protein
MNERLKQLAIESKLIAPEYNGFDHTRLSISQQKFAELIVQKCMDIAKYHTPDTEECEYTWLIHDKIQEYFGVEE